MGESGHKYYNTILYIMVRWPPFWRTFEKSVFTASPKTLRNFWFKFVYREAFTTFFKTVSAISPPKIKPIFMTPLFPFPLLYLSRSPLTKKQRAIKNIPDMFFEIIVFGIMCVNFKQPASRGENWPAIKVGYLVRTLKMRKMQITWRIIAACLFVLIFFKKRITQKPWSIFNLPQILMAGLNTIMKIMRNFWKFARKTVTFVGRYLN